MKRTILIAIVALALVRAAQAQDSFDELAADYNQQIATSPYFKDEIKLPPGFNSNDFTLVEKAIEQNPRYAGYVYNKLDYIKDYHGKGSDIVVLYGDEIVLIEKTGDKLEIKSASKGSDELNNSSKFYQIHGQYFILQGLTDTSNISEYRLLKLDGYKIAQIGGNVATKGTDLPPADEVSLSINTNNFLPRIVFLEPQVWLELTGRSGNYKQNNQGRVTLELQNGQWNLISGQKA